MKLIFCPQCNDVVRLSRSPRSCECGASFGKYHVNGINAEIGGKAIPLGFANSSFLAALRNRPKQGMGAEFTAFVIPEKADHVQQLR